MLSVGSFVLFAQLSEPFRQCTSNFLPRNAPVMYPSTEIHGKRYIMGIVRPTLETHFLCAATAAILIFPFALIEHLRSMEGGWSTIPVGLIFLSSSMQWLSSLSAYVVLAMIEPLSHNIAKITQRLCVIISSVIVFGNPIAASNALGILIAFCGVALYSAVRLRMAASHIRREEEEE